MSADTTQILDRLTTLLALFNRGSLDLPDGFIDRNAVFRLNGVAYEETLGRQAADPLVRLIARGPGGYRFLAKAIRYAIPDAVAALGTLERSSRGTGCALRGGATLTGALRGPGGPLQAHCQAELLFDDQGRLTGLDVEMAAIHVARIRAAREGQEAT